MLHYFTFRALKSREGRRTEQTWKKHVEIRVCVLTPQIYTAKLHARSLLVSEAFQMRNGDASDYGNVEPIKACGHELWKLSPSLVLDLEHHLPHPEGVEDCSATQKE